MIPVYQYSLSDVQKYSKYKGQLKNTNKQKKQQQIDKTKKKQKKHQQKDEKRDQLLRQKMGILRNSIVEQDPKALKRTGVQQDEMDGFLTGLEFDELKRHYNDYNFADLILELPNPDQDPPEKTCLNRPVDFKEAEKVFDDMLTVMGNEGYSKAQLKSEREAFLYSFLLLDDYVDEKAKKKKTEKTNKKFEKRTQQLTQYEHFLLQVQDIKRQQEQDRRDDLLLNNNMGFREDIDVLSTGENMLHLLTSIKLSDVSQFSKVQKAYSLGGFLKKNVIKKLIRGKEKIDFDWICKNNPPKDFVTLVRNTIMYKLTQNANLHTRQFIKSDGASIFMAIKGSEAVIKKEAKDSKQTKQLELGYADLFSLEPVDKLYRPFRLKKIVRSAVNQVLEHRQKKLNFNKESNINQTLAEDKKIEQIAKGEYLVKIKADKNEFWNCLAIKQIEVDQWMQDLAEDLKIDTSHEKTAIIDDDQSTTREEWNAYYIYLFYLCEFSRRMKKLTKIGKNDQLDQAKRGGNTNIIEMNKGFLYKLIFRKALGDANEIHKQIHGFFASSQILKTLWHQMGMKDPISPFTDYFESTSNSGEKEETIWRQYEVNEKGYRSTFLNMEKIKLTNSIVLKQINLSRLIKAGLVTAYFPINDCYQLLGKKKEDFFQELKIYDLVAQDRETTSERELRKMFQTMQDEAESTDFDSKCLVEETAFQKYVPWHISESAMRDYFGEKIAIYFRFLSFYTFHLGYMSLLGIFMQVIHQYGSTDFVKTLNILFAIIIIVWSTMFIEIWKREQVMFSVRFGQQDFEEDEAERPSFEGVYRRNITNDDLNEEYYSPYRRKSKMLTSALVSIIIIGIAIVFVFLIFNFKLWLIGKDFQELRNSIINANTVPAIMNAGQIILFNLLYDYVGEQLNNFENHKILSSYENSLVAKVFLFQFFNLFNSCIFIAFLSPLFPELHLCEYESGQEDCFQQLRIQIMIIFLVNFGKNIPELVVPVVKTICKKKFSQLSSDETPIVHPFKEIDEFVEKESILEPYLTNEEVDGTVADYMELVIQFSFLTLFGLSFPTSFVLAFLNNIAEIQVDKLKLTRFSRRPMPSGASNIGTWLLILDIITFCSIFSNAGLIAYTSSPIILGNFRLINMGDDYVSGEEDERILIFSSLLIVFLAVKYFFRFIIPDTPQIAIILNKRHKVAVDTVVRGFQKSKSKIYKTAKLNFSIGGIIYQNDEFEALGIDKLETENQQQMGPTNPNMSNLQGSNILNPNNNNNNSVYLQQH